MAIKRLIDAAAFAALNATLQVEYKKQDDGSFVLDLTDYESPQKLLDAKNHEKTARQAAEKAARELQASLDSLTEERDGLLRGAIPKADVEKLEGSWKTKLAAREKELTAQIDAANGTLQTLLVDNVAQSMASEISTAPAVLLPHIQKRLKTEKNAEGKFETKVLDKDGKPSALTVAELKEEFRLHPDFKAIITASRASGGGAGGGGGGGGAAPGKINWAGSPKDIAAGLKSKVDALPAS